MKNLQNGKYVIGILDNVKITKAGKFKNESGETLQYGNSIKLTITYSYTKEIEIGGQMIEQEQKVEEIIKLKIEKEQDVPLIFKQISSLKDKRLMVPFNLNNFNQIVELKIDQK
jgi:hypothetical protein